MAILTANSETLAGLRKGLADLSWFMLKRAAGRSNSLVDAAARFSRRWFQGKAAARTAFVQAGGSTPSRKPTSP